MRFSRWAPVVAAVALTAGVVIAQRSTADQGRPGKEGPWPVTGVVQVASGSLDGGNSDAVVAVRPYRCGTLSPYKTTTVTSAAAVSVPAAPATAPRAYMVVCNPAQNTGDVKCRGDGVDPVFALGNPGDYLANGNCVKYTQANLGDAGSSVICISNQAATFQATSFECL